jgi:hypothetical protein
LDLMDSKSKGRIAMKPTRKHLVGVAAALSTIALAAPVSSAGAATAAPVTSAVAAQAATVTPQTFVTAGPSTFVNYNSQTSAGAISAGDQVAG